MILLIFFVVLAIFLAQIEIKRLKFNRQFKHIPGVRELPIIGSVFSIRPNYLTDFEWAFSLLFKNPVTKVSFGGLMVLVVTDPVVLQELYSSNLFLAKPYLYNFLEMENGLFTAKFDIWKPLRKTLNMAFNQRRIQSFAPKFNQHIDNLCNEIQSFVGKGLFDICELTNVFAFEQIFDTMFEIDYKCDQIFPKLLSSFTDGVSQRMVNPILHFNVFYRFTKVCKDIQAFYKYFESMRDKFKPGMAKLRSQVEQGREIDQHTFLAELARFQKNGRFLTEFEVDDNLRAMIGAGSETSAFTMANAILMLAMHPEIDQKLYEDISEKYQPGQVLDHQTVKEMNYLDMFFKEVLRLFPAAPINGRICNQDTYLETIKAKVTKDVLLLFPLFKLHKDPRYWGPNADKFNPDNFLPENVAKRHPYCYMPYSNGARNCIGIHYANLSLRMALVKIILKYKFTTDLKYEDLRLKWGLVYKFDTKYLVQAHKRN